MSYAQPMMTAEDSITVSVAASIMQDIPASSVYTAGPHHALFSLSLTDVYRTDYGMSTDFAKIEGLPVGSLLQVDDSGYTTLSALAQQTKDRLRQQVHFSTRHFAWA